MKKIAKIKYDLLAVGLLLALSIFAFKAFFPSGSFYTHDDIHHMVRIANYAHELQQGQFPVRMATQMGNGYGYPIFNYAYPLPYFLASVMHLAGLSITASYKLLVLGATIFGVMSMYAFLRSTKHIVPALAGTVVYLFVPYRFLALFVTGQIGAILSFFFAPILLLLTQKILTTQGTKKQPVFIFLFALAVCGMVLSHPVSAALILPIVTAYFIFELFQKKKSKRKELALHFFGASILGFALSSFYLVPSFAELKYIKAGYENIVNYGDHFVSIKQLLYSRWGYGYSDPGYADQISFQVGIGQWLVVLGSVFAILFAFLRKKVSFLQKHTDTYIATIPVARLVLYLGIIVVSVFCMTQFSDLLWQSIPGLSKIQHPWRFLIVPTVVVPLLCAELVAVFKKIWLQIVFFIGVLVVTVYMNRNYLTPMELTRYQDDHYTSNQQWMRGSADISWEFLPHTAVQPKEISHRVIEDTTLSSSMIFTTTASESSQLTVHIFDFPSWQIHVDGVQQKKGISEEGLISFPLTEGEHAVEIYLEQTKVQKMGNALSILAFLVLCGWVVSMKKMKK